MSEVVERVALAINETANKLFNAHYVDREASMVLAHAAIEAMRVPTKAMVKVGEAEYCLCQRAPEIWQAMIDTALKP